MKILIDKATVEQALEALEFYVEEDDVIEGMEGNEYWVEGKRSAEKSIVAFQKALAQPVQPERQPRTNELSRLLFAVGQAVENGAAPFDIEDAYEDYEKAEATKRKESND